MIKHCYCFRCFTFQPYDPRTFKAACKGGGRSQKDYSRLPEREELLSLTQSRDDLDQLLSATIAPFYHGMCNDRPNITFVTDVDRRALQKVSHCHLLRTFACCLGLNPRCDSSFCLQDTQWTVWFMKRSLLCQYMGQTRCQQHYRSHIMLICMLTSNFTSSSDIQGQWSPICLQPHTVLQMNLLEEHPFSFRRTAQVAITLAVVGTRKDVESTSYRNKTLIK